MALDREFSVLPRQNVFNIAKNSVNDVASMLDDLKLVPASNTNTSSRFEDPRELGQWKKLDGNSGIFTNESIVTLWNNYNVQSLENIQLFSPNNYVESNQILTCGNNIVKLWEPKKMQSHVFNSQTDNLGLLNLNVLTIKDSLRRCVFKKKEAIYLFNKELINDRQLILQSLDIPERNKSIFDSGIDFDDQLSWKSEIIPSASINIKSINLKRRNDDLLSNKKKVATFCNRCQQISVDGFCNNVCHNLKRKQYNNIEEECDIKLKVRRKEETDLAPNNQDGASRINRKRKNVFNDIMSSTLFKIPRLHLLRKNTIHRSSIVI